MTTQQTCLEAGHEVTRLLERIEALVRELRSPKQRGGVDIALKEQELERLRWRLAVVVREMGAAA